MMDDIHFIFGHRGARYGLPVSAVREIVWLPELSPIEELPPYITGVFNLRGRVVPVMDLGLRFGHAHEPYLTGDRVIVIGSDEARVGVVANELYDVLVIPPSAIKTPASYQGAGGHEHFVRGAAMLNDGLAMLLDIDALLGSAPTEETLALHTPGAPEELSHLFEKLSAEEAELFRGRARSLAQVQEATERSGLEGYAVIRLNDESFGIGLDLVREFSHLHSIVPVPCCPAWVLGNMNLRGDILTLVDIRPALGMAIEGATSEVVVLRIGELLLGLPAAEIVDVVHLAPADIAAVPIASDRAGKAYCKGVASVGGHAVGILDLETILAELELQVAEQVQ